MKTCSFKNMTPQKELITCIILTFAINALFNIFYTYQYFFEANTVVNNILSLCGKSLTLLVYLKLVTSRNTEINKKGRIGLSLLVLQTLLCMIENIVLNIVTIQPITISLFAILLFVIDIIGLFTFVNGCNITAKLRRFIKWTPFIPSFIRVPLILLSAKTYTHAASVILDLCFLYIVYKLSGISEINNE